jgi:hypothetical protein
MLLITIGGGADEHLRLAKTLLTYLPTGHLTTSLTPGCGVCRERALLFLSRLPQSINLALLVGREHPALALLHWNCSLRFMWGVHGVAVKGHFEGR